ncbi:hypothetical protein [Stutzerimonas nitrititolerans]|uniref:hypothetical protein n=1 Tax=Stutzerimonas nitrititolerans TaxID=2482751 RepID=UPI0028A73B6A|nr:hypothetical protein [Stutzerimonas nitrititolerans]
MPARNTDNEQPGTRYGKRVVLRSGVILCGQTKYVGLRVICDCGRVDLVRKSYLVRGRGLQCPDCEADERSKAMQGHKRGQPWRNGRSELTAP